MRRLKLPDWDGFCTFHRLAQGVLEELQLHQGYANQWGVDLKQINPVTATRHYTDFQVNIWAGFLFPIN